MGTREHRKEEIIASNQLQNMHIDFFYSMMHGAASLKIINCVHILLSRTIEITFLSWIIGVPYCDWQQQLFPLHMITTDAPITVTWTEMLALDDDQNCFVDISNSRQQQSSISSFIIAPLASWRLRSTDMGKLASSKAIRDEKCHSGVKDRIGKAKKNRRRPLQFPLETDPIKLNVGGRLFETGRSTLHENDFFERLLSGRWQPMLDQVHCSLPDYVKEKYYVFIPEGSYFCRSKLRTLRVGARLSSRRSDPTCRLNSAETAAGGGWILSNSPIKGAHQDGSGADGDSYNLELGAQYHVETEGAAEHRRWGGSQWSADIHQPLRLLPRLFYVLFFALHIHMANATMFLIDYLIYGYDIALSVGEHNVGPENVLKLLKDVLALRSSRLVSRTSRLSSRQSCQLSTTL